MDKEDVLKRSFKKEYVDFSPDCERVKRSDEKRLRKSEKKIRKSSKTTSKHKKSKNIERKNFQELLNFIKSRIK